jgi:hypothetical protein
LWEIERALSIIIAAKGGKMEKIVNDVLLNTETCTLLGDTGWLQSSHGDEDFCFYILVRHRLYLTPGNELFGVKETRDCKKAAWFSHNHEFHNHIARTNVGLVSLSHAWELADAYQNWPRKPKEYTDTCDMYRNVKEKLRELAVQKQGEHILHPTTAVLRKGTVAPHKGLLLWL